MDQQERIRRASSLDQTQDGTAAPAVEEHESGHVFSAVEAARIILVALAAAAVWFHVWEPFPRVSLIGVLGVLIGGWPIFKEAAENAAARRMTMELSMSIALVAAAAISQFFTALIITLFVLIAEVLEGMTVSRGRRAIRDLMDFLPRSVIVRSAGGVHETSIDQLRAGDSVLVNPGGLVPIDGTVLSGHSFVDQARITGESMPVEKLPRSVVYAGTINQTGALEIRVERIGRDTSYGRIIEAVEHAERSRAPVQQLADRLAGYLSLFCAHGRGNHVHHHARPAFNDFGNNRRGRVRRRRRHAVGNSRRHRPLGAPWSDYQRRPLPGNFGQGGYCRSRQDRNADLRPHRSAIDSSGRGCLRS